MGLKKKEKKKKKKKKRKLSALKIENFIRKALIVFLFLLDCAWVHIRTPHRSGSNEYPQSMFGSKTKKNRYAPAFPSFFYIKVGYVGVYFSWTCFPDDYFII